MHERVQALPAAVDCLSLQELTWRSLTDANIGAVYWELGTRRIDVNSAIERTLALPSGIHGIDIREFYKAIYREDRLKLRNSLGNFVRQASPDPLELHFRVRARDGQLRKLSCILRIQFNEAAQVTHLLGIASDHTDLEIARTETLKRSDLECLLIAISIKLMRAPVDETDSIITESLGDTCEFVGADRAYRIDYDWSAGLCSNTHEWCAEGIEPQIDNLQNVPVSEIPLWTSSHQQGLPFIVSSVMTLPQKHPLRTILEPQGIQSIVTLPIMNDGECMGFIGFDSVKVRRSYSLTEVSLLELLAQLIANSELRRRREKQLLDTLSLLQESRNSAITMAAIARSANEAKSRFIATMSHEIRTPLHVILGMTELLETELVDGQQRYQLNALRSAGRTLSELVGDILDISRIESGNIGLEKQRFSLRDLLFNIRSVIEPYCNEKQVDFVINMSPDMPDVIVHDETRIRQILINLLSNAIKFTHVGSIALDIFLDQHSEAQPGTLNLRITDTGIGMSQEVLKRVHEPFFQAQTDHDTKLHGTGLGLPIVFNLVDLMSGSISIESEPAKGSMFWIRIPTEVDWSQTSQPSGCEEPTDDQSVVPNETASIDAATILVVEDNEMNQRLIQAHLAKHRCNVVIAENGAAAVSLVESQDFDVILMDCRMPVMDGFESTRLIRQHLRKSGRVQPPIIAVTANAVEGDRERCLDAGMNAMLKKPFTRQELLTTMESWIRQSSGQHPHGLN
ncbi:MAG: response regulator [Haliea sp.]